MSVRSPIAASGPVQVAYNRTGGANAIAHAVATGWHALAAPHTVSRNTVESTFCTDPQAANQPVFRIIRVSRCS